MPKVEYLTSDEHHSLVVKGDFNKFQILEMAIKQHVIDEGDFENSEYYQSHFKVEPAATSSGYKVWNHPIKKPCKGSYFASVLCQ
jgi:hypothetical protein